MFDVFLALLLLRAIIVSARRRALGALGGAAAGAALFLLLGLAGWYGRVADTLGRAGFLMLALFGPSTLPGPTPRVPLSALLGAHPLSARLALFALLAGGFALVWRAAGRFSPLSDESDRHKEVGLALLAPAVLVLVQLLSFALAGAVSDPF